MIIHIESWTVGVDPSMFGGYNCDRGANMEEALRMIRDDVVRNPPKYPQIQKYRLLQIQAVSRMIRQ